MACKRAYSAVICTFEITNSKSTGEDLYLLTYNTPFEGPYSPFITVFFDDKPLRYEGILASHTPPTKERFVRIRREQSVVASIQITDVFNFHRDGHYIVEYAQPLQYLSKHEMKQQKSYDVIKVTRSVFPYQSVDLYLDETRSLDKPMQHDEQTAGKEVITIRKCRTTVSIGTDPSIVEAHKKLCSRVHKVKDAIDRKNKTLYREWFEARPHRGPHYEHHKYRVKHVFRKIDHRIRSKSVKYVINGVNCQPNWGAYTYKGSTTTYICPALSSFPTLCSDDTKYNKEGVLLHEWSHAFGHTSNHAYGPEESRKLAKNYPYLAVDNANNYMYYYCLSDVGNFARD